MSDDDTYDVAGLAPWSASYDHGPDCKLCQKTKLFDSEPLKAVGDFKRVSGRAVYPNGEIDFDGMINGQVTITVRCSFADGQRIADATGKMLGGACDVTRDKTNIPTVVLAGSYVQFINWCIEHQVSPTNRRLIPVLDLHDAQKMRGLAGPKRGGSAVLVFGPGWDRIRGLGEIRDTALACGFEWGTS